MAYGLSTRLFIENGPAARSALLRAGRSRAKAHHLAWRTLDMESRLDLVDHELKIAA